MPLPDGLSLSSTGLLSGTPTAEGDFVFTAQVQDRNGNIVTKEFTLAVRGTGITTNVLPNASQNEPYSFALQATGGLQPYTWAIDSGTLPTGLTLSSDGIISGTPTVLETQTFTVSLTDANGAVKTKEFSLTVGGLTITTSTPLRDGRVGFAYIQRLDGSGGTLPYSWSVDSGVLPDGVALFDTGVLNGSPESDGIFSFTLMLTDANGATTTKAFTATIKLPGDPF